MSNEKVMENRMRRTADRLGYSVSKSRVTGLWHLRDEELRFFTGEVNLEGVSVEKVAEHLEDALQAEAEQREEREQAEERFFLEKARSKYPRLFGEEYEDGEE